MSTTPHMDVSLAGIALSGPLIAAAGTAGYIDEVANVVPRGALGAVVSKSITREPREGNAPWRILDAGDGMLNAIGLANVGLERFLREKLPAAASLGMPVIGSIAGHSIDDYLAVALAFDEEPLLPAVELNVSCPNTDDGRQFGDDPAVLANLLRVIRPALAQTKMFVKLSPNTNDISAMARAAIDAGADALTLVNTVSALAIDVETRRPRLSRGYGGLSGPAIHPIAVRMVREVYDDVARHANVPIIGVGGVLTWRDAAEMVLAGATAVGMGTALFVDPVIPRRVRSGLTRWVERQGADRLTDLVGQMRTGDE